MKLKVFFNKIKQILIKIKDFIIEYKNVLYMSIPLLLMDIVTRFLGRGINFYKIHRFVPNFFTIIWVLFIVGMSISFKKKIGRIIYLVINIIFMSFFLINNIYYSMTSNFFNFILFESASEGMPYIFDTLKNCNILVYISFVVIVISFIWAYKNIPDNKKFDFKNFSIVLILFLVLHIITPLFLGKSNSNLVWNTWKNPRNVYISFNDSNKSMKVSGLFEYTVRDFYVTYLRDQKEDKSELDFLKEIYDVENVDKNNKYTGMYKGKNLILLQLESIDNWLINKNDTPTLYKMLNNSINFTNHYSFYNGGGSTFNSEFAVNTGFIVPISYNKNAYTFNNNNFPYSMAKLFKSNDYIVDAFHMNNKEYYSRGINYKNWGYDNYYGLIDMKTYDDKSYELDRELINNQSFSDLMFPTDNNFVNYIITYSAHLPFSNTAGVCKMLYDMDNEGKEVEFIQMTEEECVRRQAKETDYMVELLLNKLEEKDLIDDTIIVVFTDHYLYTLNDKTILDKYKTTDNNLINKTPFFIWNGGKNKKTIKKVTSQLDILPTVLNLFGIEYNSNYYIGNDALDNSYSGVVFFSDYSWYNGNIYVENAKVTNNKKINASLLEEKNASIHNLIMKNDLTLKYNYFGTLIKNKLN